MWERRNKQRATDFAPAVASGLICDESLWSVPAAILALLNVSPPICMMFLSASVNAKVDNCRSQLSYKDLLGFYKVKSHGEG
ncbi:hypothetical protein CRYUN_Cryun06bG0085300 [Craigia yunnanensis]